MTQFDLLKAGYRQLIERGEMTAEEVAAKIRVLDFLLPAAKMTSMRLWIPQSSAISSKVIPKKPATRLV